VCSGKIKEDFALSKTGFTLVIDNSIPRRGKIGKRFFSIKRVACFSGFFVAGFPALKILRFSSALYLVILSSLTSSLRKVYLLFSSCPDALNLTLTMYGRCGFDLLRKKVLKIEKMKKIN
jgi:hypothetical protein